MWIKLGNGNLVNSDMIVTLSIQPEYNSWWYINAELSNGKDLGVSVRFTNQQDAKDYLAALEAILLPKTFDGTAEQLAKAVLQGDTTAGRALHDRMTELIGEGRLNG